MDYTQALDAIELVKQKDAKIEALTKEVERLTKENAELRATIDSQEKMITLLQNVPG
ncbi:MAG TPA: hypothetical protein VJC11_02205 [Patescibacteria group bacterium]|nr:hypothetical protein [Patescibacteria group bacterium]